LVSKEELAGLRQLLDTLKLGSMTIRENGRDVTQREIDRLVSVLAQHRQKNRGNANGPVS
jgi:hypothetical protein